MLQYKMHEIQLHKKISLHQARFSTANFKKVLDLKKNTGKEENRARDLFYGLWIPDLFMKRVIEDKDWTLMCPNECPGLPEVWGE